MDCYLGKCQVQTFTFPDYGESKMPYHVRRPGRKQSKSKSRGKQSLQKPNGVIDVETPGLPKLLSASGPTSFAEDVVVIPEPSTLGLCVLGPLSLGYVGWRRRRR